MFAMHVSPKSADLLILAGQITLGDPGYPHHVAVVTQAASPDFEDRSGPGHASVTGVGPRIVQAMPKGAEEIEIGVSHTGGDYIYLRPAYEPGQGERVAAAARSYIDTPYSFLDYAAIEGRHILALKPEDRTMFDRYITGTGHLICSQLGDKSLDDADFHAFADGRIPQDVTPSALFEKLKAMPGTAVVQ